MARQHGRPLSATFVGRTREVGVHGDGFGGFGLGLRVHRMKTGGLSKSWRQRVTINGRRTVLGLGSYPLITLAEAREKALRNARAIAQGLDPRKPRKRVPSFSDCARAVIALHRPTWKRATAVAWEKHLHEYAAPLAHMPVDRIEAGDVLKVLRVIWRRQPSTGKNVRQKIRRVLDYAVSEGHIRRNVAGRSLDAALPRNGSNGKRGHYRAVPYQKLGAALRRVRAGETWPGARLAVAFCALTAARPMETLQARWREIDGDTWTVPPERMKANREHVVPLSPEALAILAEARKLSPGSGLVFRGPRGGEVTRSNVSRLLRASDFGGVLHGCRAAFRTWAQDTGADRETAEMALSHRLGSSTEQAYARGDLLDRRRALMSAWGRYLSA